LHTVLEKIGFEEEGSLQPLVKQWRSNGQQDNEKDEMTSGKRGESGGDSSGPSW